MEKVDMKDLIFRYGILCGKRNSEAQKKKFLRMAKKQFEQCGYPVCVTKASLPLLKLESKNFYNLYAGDVKHAKTIFVTYYDTPAKAWIPIRHEAFHSGISKINLYVNTGILVIFLLAVLGLFYVLLLPKLNSYGFLNIWGILTLCMCLFSFLFVKRARGGIANRYNMVRNTSSIIALLKLASLLNKEQKRAVAFAFVDEGTGSEYGLHMLDAYVGKRKPVKVYVDSIGNKGILHCFTNKDLHAVFTADEIHNLDKERKHYGDILLTSGEYAQNRIIIDKANSSKDNELDNEAIESIVARLRKLLMVIME